MAVQLNSTHDGQTAQQTVARLLQSLSDGHTVLQWPQQQYWSSVGSTAWCKAQILRQADDAAAALSSECLAVIGLLLLIPLVLCLYFLPVLQKPFLRRLPPNPTICCDLAKRTLTQQPAGGSAETFCKQAWLPA